MTSLFVNLISPLLLIIVGKGLKKSTVKGVDSENEYNSPNLKRSQKRWAYFKKIAPNLFIALGKTLLPIEIFLSLIMFAFKFPADLILKIGTFLGLAFLLLAFYLTNSSIKKMFREDLKS